jgi:hypothetical protein
MVLSTTERNPKRPVSIIAPDVLVGSFTIVVPPKLSYNESVVGVVLLLLLLLQEVKNDTEILANPMANTVITVLKFVFFMLFFVLNFK